MYNPDDTPLAGGLLDLQHELEKLREFVTILKT
jgi:hypothetical protein